MKRVNKPINLALKNNIFEDIPETSVSVDQILHLLELVRIFFCAKCIFFISALVLKSLHFRTHINQFRK